MKTTEDDAFTMGLISLAGIALAVMSAQRSLFIISAGLIVFSVFYAFIAFILWLGRGLD